LKYFLDMHKHKVSFFQTAHAKVNLKRQS